jgi:hypothetical protein
MSLIQDPYNVRVKKYKVLMQKIAKLERGQQWSALYNLAVKMADKILEQEHELAKLRSKQKYIKSSLY